MSQDSKAPDQESREEPTMDDLISFVDSEFKPGSYLSKIKYHWLDVLLAFLVLIVVLIVMSVLILAAPLLATEPVSVAALLAFFALALSLLQFVAKWMETPSPGGKAYLEHVVKENCEALSETHRIGNDLLLYALVSMKSERPRVKLAEVKQSAPELFSSPALVSRLYRPEA